MEACEGPITDTYNNKFFDMLRYITFLQYKPSTGTISISEKTWKKLSRYPANYGKKRQGDGDFFTKIGVAEVEKVSKP